MFTSNEEIISKIYLSEVKTLNLSCCLNLKNYFLWVKIRIVATIQYIVNINNIYAIKKPNFKDTIVLRSTLDD